MKKNSITYISILRGINVGGNRKINMVDLRKMYVELGFSNVRSYIQSGNIIFDSNETDGVLLGQKIKDHIFTSFGFDVPVLLFTTDEWNKILINNPFRNDASRNENLIHIVFLSEIPDPFLLNNIESDLFLPDEFKCIDNVVYLYCPNGYSNTKLNNNFFEKKLKMIASTRNLQTVIKLSLPNNI